ncbi:hypothetical protein QTI66_23835 [Variovorax sp. J22R133]|nr:hypothetical protein [Variovorax sp. J22R133]MDM0115202.1 hypothetical protein [Variovorax sp. J22R133]
MNIMRRASHRLTHWLATIARRIDRGVTASGALIDAGTPHPGEQR